MFYNFIRMHVGVSHAPALIYLSTLFLYFFSYHSFLYIHTFLSNFQYSDRNLSFFPFLVPSTQFLYVLGRF